MLLCKHMRQNKMNSRDWLKVLKAIGGFLLLWKRKDDDAEDITKYECEDYHHETKVRQPSEGASSYARPVDDGAKSAGRAER